MAPSFNMLLWDNGYENGLTIPYLVGASTIISPDKPLMTINKLILDAQNLSLPHK
ncbi:hypothetical protein [Ochrovirga pacifica]|uniref:hypothetical protein n=1 Tax=Ochrovirga pacifica TaxID=1042376 RepID=UPI00030EE4EB|nr:hypothetical protein [Ochrovirga pacifica]